MRRWTDGWFNVQWCDGLCARVCVCVSCVCGLDVVVCVFGVCVRLVFFVVVGVLCC